jgi:hypothetical protein
MEELEIAKKIIELIPHVWDGNSLEPLKNTAQGLEATWKVVSPFWGRLKQFLIRGSGESQDTHAVIEVPHISADQVLEWLKENINMTELREDFKQNGLLPETNSAHNNSGGVSIGKQENSGGTNTIIGTVHGDHADRDIIKNYNSPKKNE